MGSYPNSSTFHKQIQTNGANVNRISGFHELQFTKPFSYWRSCVWAQTAFAVWTSDFWRQNTRQSKECTQTPSEPKNQWLETTNSTKASARKFAPLQNCGTGEQLREYAARQAQSKHTTHKAKQSKTNQYKQDTNYVREFQANLGTKHPYCSRRVWQTPTSIKS